MCAKSLGSWGDIISQTTFENGKVEPISLPISDVYTSANGLNRHRRCNLSSVIALQWRTKMSYATDYPLIFLFGMLVVDSRAMASIAPADQTVVREAMRKAFKEMDEQNAKDERARAKPDRQWHTICAAQQADKAAWREMATKSMQTLRRKISTRGCLQQSCKLFPAELRKRPIMRNLLKWLYRVEDGLLVALLLAMIVLAGVDILARLALGSGMTWIAPCCAFGVVDWLAGCFGGYAQP